MLGMLTLNPHGTREFNNKVVAANARELGEKFLAKKREARAQEPAQVDGISYHINCSWPRIEIYSNKGQLRLSVKAEGALNNGIAAKYRITRGLESADRATLEAIETALNTKGVYRPTCYGESFDNRLKSAVREATREAKRSLAVATL